MIDDMDEKWLYQMYVLTKVEVPDAVNLETRGTVYGRGWPEGPLCSLCLRNAFLTEDPAWPGFFLQWASYKAVKDDLTMKDVVVPVSDRCLYCRGAESFMTAAAQQRGVLRGARNSILFAQTRWRLIDLEKTHGGMLPTNVSQLSSAPSKVPYFGQRIPRSFRNVRGSWDGLLQSVHPASQILGVRT